MRRSVFWLFTFEGEPHVLLRDCMAQTACAGAVGSGSRSALEDEENVPLDKDKVSYAMIARTAAGFSFRRVFLALRR